MAEAAQDFVCIRLATYEDAEEAEFLKEIFVGRSGELENTVFCLLAPDGRQQLSRPGRGPHFTFGSPGSMAREMKQIANRYETQDGDGIPKLPQMKNFRLGLNVAECDALPLVVCVATGDHNMQSLHDSLAPLAFQDQLAGRFGYASVKDLSEMESIDGKKTEYGFLIVEPGEFGTKGIVRQTISGDVSSDDLAGQLIAFANEFRRRDKDHHDHVRTGKENGVDWETEIPVTDPMSNAARDRRGPGKGKRPPRRRKRGDR